MNIQKNVYPTYNIQFLKCLQILFFCNQSVRSFYFVYLCKMCNMYSEQITSKINICFPDYAFPILIVCSFPDLQLLFFDHIPFFFFKLNDGTMNLLLIFPQILFIIIRSFYFVSRIFVVVVVVNVQYVLWKDDKPNYVFPMLTHLLSLKLVSPL